MGACLEMGLGSKRLHEISRLTRESVAVVFPPPLFFSSPANGEQWEAGWRARGTPAQKALRTLTSDHGGVRRAG